MSPGLQMLWLVYEWLPLAFLLDFVIFQVSLRLRYRRETRVPSSTPRPDDRGRRPVS